MASAAVPLDETIIGAGEMGERIRAFDWSSHPLGPPERWPQSLKTMVRVMLGSRYAMWLGWGDDLYFFYNDAYAKMTLGPKHPAALGRPTRDVWPEIWADIGGRAEHVLRTGQATWDEGYGMPKGHLPVRGYLAVPVRSRSGEVLGGLFFGHSQPGVFTERAERLAEGIASQAAIAIDNARLYGQAQSELAVRKVTEAALRESEQRERDARAEAERASRLKDEFLASLSHELRTPLNAIVGWSRLIEQRPEDPKTVRQGIEVIARNAKVQTDLIADLLDMSRIISGKLRLDVEQVLLGDVVSAAVDSIKHAAETKGVRLQPMISPVPDPVRGDASRLQQIVWNLLSNAVKFTPRGGRIQIVMTRRGSHVEVVVSDTGVGIKPEFLPHIFERFRQADASVARHFGGLGLGLSIVKHLVELHGGTIHVVSPGEGQGATFTVQFPLAVVHARTGDRRATFIDQRLGGTDTELDGIRVLAVDDQPDARELVKRVLDERGATVTTAGSVDEALEMLEQHRPHVVLCDIGMPGKDGYEFIREVRRLGHTTPAVAVTAFARPEDRLLALRAGYQGHVVKPVEPAELIATVAVFAGQPFGSDPSAAS